MTTRRTIRINSLLKEVISEVIKKDVSNPKVSVFVTITKVEVSKDLHHARVFFSVIGTEEEKQNTLEALQSASGYIAVLASKQVVLRHFPNLTFKIDDSVDKHMRIDSILKEIKEEKLSRKDDPSEF